MGEIHCRRFVLFVTIEAIITGVVAVEFGGGDAACTARGATTAVSTAAPAADNCIDDSSANDTATATGTGGTPDADPAPDAEAMTSSNATDVVYLNDTAAAKLKGG